VNVHKEVLLARPHPFIVAEMVPFLTQLGFTPVRLHSVAELAAATPRAVGAVISLAVGSTIPESAAEVLTALRRHDVRIPLLFASLLDFDTARSVLAGLAEKTGVGAKLIGVGAADSHDRDLGKPETFLYVAKSDVETPAQRELVGRMLLRHFA
jgi:hypothetical protein